MSTTDVRSMTVDALLVALNDRIATGKTTHPFAAEVHRRLRKLAAIEAMAAKPICLHDVLIDAIRSDTL